MDHQAHGVVHNIPMSDSSTDEFLSGELQGSISNMQKYYNKTPIAIIWPGGGFGVRPVQFARKLATALGSRSIRRGHLMFNWVPLADQQDPVGLVHSRRSRQRPPHGASAVLAAAGPAESGCRSPDGRAGSRVRRAE